jgi:FKBP12-rapamycin complex-associated protein
MGSFVKDTALSYLDDKSSTIRKAAAKAVALLSARRPKISQLLLSHNVMYEILEKLLTIAISDPDMEVREIMLGS